MTVIVFAAFLASGGLNAGTPLAIASTPVSATEPAGERLEQQQDAERLGAERDTRRGCGGSGCRRPGRRSASRRSR